jgi:hypothetical protein
MISALAIQTADFLSRIIFSPDVSGSWRPNAGVRQEDPCTSIDNQKGQKVARTPERRRQA